MDYFHELYNKSFVSPNKFSWEIYTGDMLQVRKPVVCGVSPPGYDHMEILGS